MDGADRQSGAEPSGDPARDAPEADLTEHPPGADDAPPSPPYSESLTEEVSALIDDGRTYAEAELAFQKTRAKLGGKLVGVSLGLVIVALILLHIAFLALAVGLVIALEPLVTIWGAIGIVFGGLLVVVGLLCWVAFRRMKKLGALFSSPDEREDA